MNDFLRFPHTPHLVWLAPGQPREDKVLDRAEARALLDGDVVVEEKVDGANLGFSVDGGGLLRAQNRGRYLDLDAPSGQWKPLKQWLLTKRYALTEALAPGLMIFGEWCYAVHSVRYTRLPDWFLAFDVYDCRRSAFWSAQRRDEHAHALGLAVVPELGHGRFDPAGLEKLLGRSALTDGPAEGLYVRREQGGALLNRAKIVRSEFVQAIHEHWSKRRLETNQLLRTSQ